MKRGFSLTVCIVNLAVCVGCGPDYFINQIVKPKTDDGKVMIRLGGTGKKLVEQKRIDAHRRIKGEDGDVMDVWIIKALPHKDGGTARATMVLLHGLGESKAVFPYLGAGRCLARIGYDVILMDLRTHGRSEGRYVTYGAKEKKDIKAVMDKLVSEHLVNSTVYVFGENLGGSVAIQYAAIDTRCKGVMAKAPFLDVRSVARRMMPAFMAKDEFESILAEACKRGGFDAAETSTLKAAASLDIPLLLVHRQLDFLVPVADSEAVLEVAGGPKKLEIITPGPEDILLISTYEDWLAKKLHKLATEGIKEEKTEPKGEPEKK